MGEYKGKGESINVEERREKGGALRRPRYRHILDNRSLRVADYLRERLLRAKRFRLVSAYFSIYGYEVLQKELEALEEVRFLFGDPGSVGELDPGSSPDKGFSLTEGGLSPIEALKQKPLAQRCKAWVERPGVKIRSAKKSGFIHGKLYHTEAHSEAAHTEAHTEADSEANTGSAPLVDVVDADAFPQSAAGAAALVGSSNFTRRGLGCSQGGGNLEINLATQDREVTTELSAWFDALWNDRNRTEDVKSKVIEALDRIGQNYSPEQIYFKTLFELFREDLERRRRGEQQIEDIHLYDTQIWKRLYKFQRDGAKGVIDCLLKHNGCILADSVGLGKTWTALAVIKYFELRNERALLLCPRKLRENWSLYPIYNGQRNNPFEQDRFGYTLLSHTDLSRQGGRVGDVDLANFNWGNFDLLVIDESHHFRNDNNPIRDEANNIIRHSRYSRLLEEVIRANLRTKVLLLSATPVNTSLIDLRNQIYLMTERREDAFKESLGISSIGNLLAQAQKKFKRWEENRAVTGQAAGKAGGKESSRAAGKDKEAGNDKSKGQDKSMSKGQGKSRGREADQAGGRDKAALLESLDTNFFRLLGGISIARSRRQIEKFYKGDMEFIGSFPDKQPPQNIYPPTDLKQKLSFQSLSEKIDQFSLSIYQPSSYIIDPQTKRRLQQEKEERRFNQQDRERFLIGMIKTNFMKRLESSAHSLTMTLGRTIGKIEALLEKIDRYSASLGKGRLPPKGAPALQESQRDRLDEFQPEDDEEDEDFLVNRARQPYHLKQLDLEAWQSDLRQDHKALSAARDEVKAIDLQRDGKLAALKKNIRAKAGGKGAVRKSAGKKDRKLLVFTTFKDTAEYLYSNLKELAEELDLSMAMVAGDLTCTNRIGPNRFNDILTNFSPRSRQRRIESADGSDGSGSEAAEIDLLIATDCISEGQNLQDCDTVLNYDIHWNPVRLIQRFGRIDRIGSQHSSIAMINYWPTEDIEAYLRLESRVLARMALADAAATGDSDPLSSEQARTELTFRDQQLRQLRKKVIDLEEVSDSVLLSDFTLDYFISQLLAYLERERHRLENMPLGLYALVNAPADHRDGGAIFLLRQREQSGDQRERHASPLYPHYLIYIRAGGKLGYSVANASKTLSLFEKIAAGEAAPLQELCDRFDRETEQGKDMQIYNRLIEGAISHLRQAERDRQIGALQNDRDALLPELSSSPSDKEAFELVTWLALLPKKE